MVDLVQTMGGRGAALVYVACALLSFVALCGSHGVDGEVLSEARCEDLGFTGLALCSDCDSLAEYVKDKGAGALPFGLVWICLRSNP